MLQTFYYLFTSSFFKQANTLKNCLDISNSGAQLIAFLGPTV